jgi:hypothetical protein
MQALMRVRGRNTVEQDDKTKQPGLSGWSWRRRSLFRARIRSRYEHASHRGWYFPGFIYIPAVAAHHISKAKRANRSTLLDELARLAALNVPWACSILSYYALLPKEDGSRDIERAASLCQEPARAGDAYAQYMLSWALRLKGDLEGAYQNLKRSARMLFPPAVLDITSFHGLDWDAETIKRERKLRLMICDRVGHVCALARRLSFYRTGEFGKLKLMLGYILMPLAGLRMIPAVFHPFSATAFVFDRKLSSKYIFR